MFSHSDVAYICVFWEENPDSRHSFDHILRPFWRDCLGDQQRVNPSVQKAIFIEAYFWHHEITVSPLFLAVNRSACFAVSDEPTISEILASAVGALEGTIEVQVPIAYHMGVRLRLRFGVLVWPVLIQEIYFISWFLYDVTCCLLSPWPKQASARYSRPFSTASTCFSWFGWVWWVLLCLRERWSEHIHIALCSA